MRTQIEIIYQAIEFMESQLQSHVTIAQIAEYSGYSLFYFIRTFNKIAHQTPYDYLIARRLSEALKELVKTNYRVTDIALDYCFENPESFSRAFKRLFGVLPSFYRKGKLPEFVFPFQLKTMPDLQFIDRGDFAPPELVEFNEMTLVGLSTEFDSQGQEKMRSQGIRLRKQLDNNIKERNKRIVSVRSFNDKYWKQGYLFKGIEKEKGIEMIPPFTLQRIPPGQYAIIFCRANDQPAALHYLLYTWLPKIGCKMKYRFIIEEGSKNTNSEMGRIIRIPVMMI